MFIGLTITELKGSIRKYPFTKTSSFNWCIFRKTPSVVWRFSIRLGCRRIVGSIPVGSYQILKKRGFPSLAFRVEYWVSITTDSLVIVLMWHSTGSRDQNKTTASASILQGSSTWNSINPSLHAGNRHQNTSKIYINYRIYTSHKTNILQNIMARGSNYSLW